jgi:P27 family predicted phage terminase small subunit
MSEANLRIAHSRAESAGYGSWLNDPSCFDRNRFVQETKDAMIAAYGHDIQYDEHLISKLADQMEVYVACIPDIRERGIICHALNGIEMVNPSIKAKDAALGRILQILTTLGLCPSGRPKKVSTPTAIDELLAGPKPTNKVKAA